MQVTIKDKKILLIKLWHAFDYKMHFNFKDVKMLKKKSMS